MEDEQGHPADALLDRLVESIAAIPDPIERAQECVRAGDGVRSLHSKIADVRRRAIYEATLKPGATGRSVSSELGVSAKTVSLASSEFRRHDLALLLKLVDATRELLPDDPDVEHAGALLASTNSVGVAAHAVAQLSSLWLAAARIAGGDDDEWWSTYKGFERAEYLGKLAGLQRPTRTRASSIGGAEEDLHTPPPLRWPVRVLNALPGIHAFGTTEHDGSGTEWALWWSIESADPNLEIADVGPSPRGWLVSEWLVWLARDYRKAGERLESRVTAPPPTINVPGAMMTFALEGRLDGVDAVDPHEFARSVVLLWSGNGKDVVGDGYFEVEWPAEVTP